MRSIQRLSGLLSSLVFLISFITVSSAQFTIPDPCQITDIFGVSCTPIYQYNYSRPVSQNGCNFTVHFRVATNCSFKQWSIVDITPKPGNTCTFQQMFEEALVWFLQTDPVNFGPDEDECEDNYLAVNATCWHEVLEEVNGEYIVHWQPCNSSSCCVTQYRVCDNGGTKSWSRFDFESPEEDCSTSCGNNSEYVCDIQSIDVIDRSPGATKITGRSRDRADDVILSAFPNPTSQTVSLTVSPAQDAEAEIRLYSANGALIWLVKAQFTAGEVRNFEYDVSDLPDGAYFVQISGSAQTSTAMITITNN